MDKVLGYALNEWLQDIRKNQLPGLLGGVGPMHSVVQLCEYLPLGALETACALGQLSSCPWKSLGEVLRQGAEAVQPGAPKNSIPPVQGFRDLLWLPIEQYRKDGRLMRGLQRGAASFGSSTASAALELSNRLVQAIQVSRHLASGCAGQSKAGRVCHSTRFRPQSSAEGGQSGCMEHCMRNSPRE